MTKRIFLIVLDSLGVGNAPDAAAFGDRGANTLRSVLGSSACHIPNLTRMGLLAAEANDASFQPSSGTAVARMQEASLGKDTVIGHWEIAGLISQTPFPTYPKGFPDDLLAELEQRVGRGFLCNLPYSGTQVLADYGAEHLATGKYILYTSADSVMQIAAHEGKFPLAELYAACQTARELLTPPHAVGRVIARPFVGTVGTFTRTANRHDYAFPPPRKTLCDVLSGAGLDVISVGKIRDVFDGRGITRTVVAKGNSEGMERTLEMAKSDFHGLCFVNLVDFDMLYGHRRDVDGYAAALTEFDRFLPALQAKMGEEDLLMLTGDHGCDPAFCGTDHTRERTPFLIYGKSVCPRYLGDLPTFADIGKTIAGCFGVDNTLDGTDRSEMFLRK